MFYHQLTLGCAVLSLLAGEVRPATVNWTQIKDRSGGGLPDFSYCGYHASNDPLPSISAKPAKTISLGNGDQSTVIQSSLDSVAKNGGGVLLLGAGAFRLDKGIVIPANTTLRGSGINQTTLQSSAGSFDLITMGSAGQNPGLSGAANITDSYVGVGASQFNVDDSSGLKAGQTIMIQREVTAEWIKANHMDTLVRDGKPQTWIAVGTLVQQPRVVKSVSGKLVTIDVPLTDALDAKFMQGTVQTYQFPQAASEMGVENLSIKLSPTCSGKTITDKTCSSHAIVFPSWTTDSFLRNLDLTGYNEFVLFATRSFRHTVSHVDFHRDGAVNKNEETFAGYDGEIRLEGTQILVRDCGTYVSSSSDKNDLFTSFPVATEARTPGPNAVVNYHSQYPISALFPHQRWAHGFLADNCTSSLELINRGTAGSGHGWAVTSGVGWNVDASASSSHILSVSSPPTGANYCIGCRASKKQGNGTFLHYGETVQPVSLFATQLSGRRG